MDLNLKDKVALVSASSKGIGFAAACELAKEGCKVIINSRNEGELISASNQISNLTGDDVLYLCGDISDSSVCNDFVNLALSKWGRIDILVNNCGGPPPKTFIDCSDDDWLDAYNSVLMSSIRLTKLCSHHMIKNSWGRIITIGSTLMKEPSAAMVLSCTMRSAVVSYMKSVSLALASSGITVNTISTGGVSTSRLTSLLSTIASKEGINLDEKLIEAASTIPMNRFAAPQEFVQGIVFLASEKSSYITGACLSIDGGLTKSAF